jgi:drug/metabolite transporter (DMT)-like permease
MLGAALVAGAAGYWWLTESTRIGELSAVMPFRYVRLVFAIILGMTLFGERPDGWTLAGSAVIVGSGLYAFARERARLRALSGLPQGTGPS